MFMSHHHFHIHGHVQITPELLLLNGYFDISTTVLRYILVSNLPHSIKRKLIHIKCHLTKYVNYENIIMYLKKGKFV